jgi:hypothetical protein
MEWKIHRKGFTVGVCFGMNVDELEFLLSQSKGELPKPGDGIDINRMALCWMYSFNSIDKAVEFEKCASNYLKDIMRELPVLLTSSEQLTTLFATIGTVLINLYKMVTKKI